MPQVTVDRPLPCVLVLDKSCSSEGQYAHVFGTIDFLLNTIVIYHILYCECLVSFIIVAGYHVLIFSLFVAIGKSYHHFSDGLHSGRFATPMGQNAHHWLLCLVPHQG